MNWAPNISQFEMAVSAVLLNIGSIAGIWGVIWYLWDHRANAPGYLLAIGLTGLIVGSAMS